MSLTTVPTTSSTNAQSPDWRSAFNHGYDNSSVFEQGDPLPHSTLVSALQATENIQSRSEATNAIRQAVRDDELDKFPGELYPDEFGNRYKIKRGDYPGTGELRQRLDARLRSAMQNRENVVIRSPTSSGKTHIPSTTRWRDYPDVTGDKPVVVLHGTTDARNDAFGKSEASYATPQVLRGREDEDRGGCPLARGDYDSNNDKRNTPLVAPDGGEPSEWFETMCNDRGLPLSVAHSVFEQDHPGESPCCAGDDDCQSSTQWDGIPRSDNGEIYYDVLHATHQLARVPQLIEDCNVIIDEEPDFEMNLSTERVRKSVTSYLQEINAPVESWERLVMVVTGKAGADIGRLREYVNEANPDRGWFQNGDDAHALTPGIVRALLNAEEREHSRWFGQTHYTYPELIPGHDSPDHEIILRIVFDSSYEIKTLQAVPDFSRARCVIGLDAHPTKSKWQMNTLRDIKTDKLVEGEKLHEWRRKERNLKIVQVGDDKYSWTRGNSNEDKVTVLCDELRRRYEEGFQSGITALRCEKTLKGCMKRAGVENPDTIHYNKEKSVNTFEDYPVGLVAGCISPSDDDIKDWLALLDKEATPRREADGNCKGQEYVGTDADVADELLKSVCQTGVLQAVGRYARSPRDPDGGATVYVLTNVLPDEYVDKKIEGVKVFGEKQQQILDYAFNSPDGVTVQEVTENTDATRQHVNDTLKKCCSCSWVDAEEDDDRRQNPTVYDVTRCPKGLVDM
jgi:hypothetical protein